MIYLRRDSHTLAVKFALCIDAKAFDKEMRRLGHTDVEPHKNWHAAATTHFLENRGLRELVAIVFIPPNVKQSLLVHYALLVHEGTHIWQRHKKLIGEKKPSKEFEAYAMQHIALQLMDAFYKLTTKKKIKFAPE